MIDPYVYPHTDILKNLANIRDDQMLSCMEAEYTSLRLAEFVIQNHVSCFDFSTLCSAHFYIFQDIYEWAGEKRTINIEKAEAALGGISIEYSDFADIESTAISILNGMNEYSWENETIEIAAKKFSDYLAALWRTHPYREGNTRTIITFCSQFIESKGFYIDSNLFKDHAQYMRTALVAANAIFSDLGDRRNSEYLENIILDALISGRKMKESVSIAIQSAGIWVTEEQIRKIVNWNRLEQYEHSKEEIRVFLTHS